MVKVISNAREAISNFAAKLKWKKHGYKISTIDGGALYCADLDSVRELLQILYGDNVSLHTDSQGNLIATIHKVVATVTTRGAK